MVSSTRILHTPLHSLKAIFFFAQSLSIEEYLPGAVKKLFAADSDNDEDAGEFPGTYIHSNLENALMTAFRD